MKQDDFPNTGIAFTFDNLINQTTSTNNLGAKPDYAGRFNVEGKMGNLLIWKRQDKNGKEFLSIRLVPLSQRGF